MGALTLRGRALLVAGIIGLGVGWGLGQPALVPLAVLLLALPLLGVVAAHRSRSTLGVARAVTPTLLPFGGEGKVVLNVENASRVPSGALLLTDEVPESLGWSTRLVLDRVPPRSRRTVAYPISGLRRGAATVGPLTVTVTDPFGTAQQDRTLGGTTEVLVIPRLVPLDGSGTSIPSIGRGEAHVRATSARGDDDLLPREHRPGDDMRRIHWRATARHGELMVRREEQARNRTLTLVLDDRASAHEGSSRDSSFEWAVSACASIAVHYLEQGWRIRAVTTSGDLLGEAAGTLPADALGLLRAFAEVRARSGEQRLARRGALLRTDDGTAAVVAVLGHLTGDDAAAGLAPPAGAFAACLALEPVPAALLAAGGWRVAGWTRSQSVQQAWSTVAPAGAGRR